MTADESNQPAFHAPELERSLPIGDLLALGTQIRADITPSSLLHEATETIHHMLQGAAVHVRLRNPDTDELEAVAFAGVPADRQAKIRATAVVPSFYQSLLQPHARISDSFLLPADQGVACEPSDVGADDAAITATDWLLTPLRGRGERLIGIIYTATPPHSNRLILASIRVLEAIARQAALALENARLADRSARLLAKEQLLVDLGRDVSATLELDTILERTVERLDVAFQNGAIMLLNDDGEPTLVAAVDPENAAICDVWSILCRRVIDWVQQSGQTYFSNDIINDIIAEHNQRLQLALHDDETPPDLVYRSCIIAPLRSGGQVIGMLNVGNPQPQALSYDDIDLLEAIAAQVGGPITSARLYHESQRLTAQIQRRAEQLTVLNTLARFVTSTLDLSTILNDATRHIRRGFGYSHVELFLVKDESSELELAAIDGYRSDAITIGYRQSISAGLLGRAVRTADVQQVNDVQLDTEYLPRSDHTDTRSELCVPIVSSGNVLGVLNLESAQTGAFTGEDVAALKIAADMLAGAISNARLYKRAQEAAALEERNRLARELHDSVTQQLFSIVLTAQAARTQAAKSPQRLNATLERLQETATTALAEMRALISQLRPPALADQGLTAALQQHTSSLSRREGLRIELSVVGDERYARGIEQPLYRIAQEALNNVVKHARATVVRVALEFSSECVRVSVVDDGQGFDPHAPPDGNGRHLGLISMRERAAEIGGTMHIRSTIGGGAEVTVTIPRSPGDRD